MNPERTTKIPKVICPHCDRSFPRPVWKPTSFLFSWQEVITQKHPGVEVEGFDDCVKRAPNRKYYSFKESRYVNLTRIAELLDLGKKLLLIDNDGNDISQGVLRLVAFERLQRLPTEKLFQLSVQK